MSFGVAGGGGGGGGGSGSISGCGGRKRTQSFSNTNNMTVSGSYGSGGGGAAIPNKKKKKVYKRGIFVPPTKFLLGGNIRDPLNLSGLQEEDESKPEESPRNEIASLTEFLLGGNINDPLNLKGIAEQDVEKQPATVTVTPAAAVAVAAAMTTDSETTAVPVAATATATATTATATTGASDDDDDDDDDEKKAAPPQEEEKPETGAESGDVEAADANKTKEDVAVHEEKPQSALVENCLNGAKVNNSNLNLSVDIRARRLEKKDKIVSPVIPQPYRPLKTVPFRQIITPDLGNKVLKTPRFQERNTRFQYGNYNRYYGYRNVNNGVDLRLEIFEKHIELFANKDILDIGCNIGHISLMIARSFNAKSVTGLDIDRYLIDVAKRNIQYYVNCPSPYTMESPSPMESTNRKPNLKYRCYPVSMPILYGPIYEEDFRSESFGAFPKNVRFVHGNYVVENESQLLAEQPQYDTILCLSVTKWIHLNWGDEGLKLAFKRMYAQLKPGGILILEPQSWDSYKRKKTLTETIWKNYQSITLFPHHFDRYLLSSEVGFSRCYTLAVVNHQHKGFRRGIKVFKKSASSVRTVVSPDDKR